MYTLIIGNLFILVLIAAWQDFRSYRIGNAIVFPGALLGILLNTLLPAGIGFFESLAGWGTGLLLLLPLYLLRMMGAGDVKMLAMIGAFVGWHDIFWVLLYTLAAGGVLALIVALQRGVLRRLLDNLVIMFLMVLSVDKSKSLNWNASGLDAASSAGKLPYGIAIAIGTFIFLVISNYSNIAG